MKRDKMSAETQSENAQQMPAKRKPGFQPGCAPGPGRPKKIYTAQELMDKQIRRDLKAVAKDHSPEAFRFLLETMRDTGAGLQHRLNAATQILDRGWGKPTNQTEIKIDVYEKMSDQELIKLITGKELDADEIAAARADLDDGMTIDHEPSDMDQNEGE